MAFTRTRVLRAQDLLDEETDLFDNRVTQADFSFGTHAHDFHELFLIVHGSAMHHVNGNCPVVRKEPGLSVQGVSGRTGKNPDRVCEQPSFELCRKHACPQRFGCADHLNGCRVREPEPLSSSVQGTIRTNAPNLQERASETVAALSGAMHGACRRPQMAHCVRCCLRIAAQQPDAFFSCVAEHHLHVVVLRL